MKLDKSTIDYIDIDLNGTCNLACPMCTFNYLDVDPPNHLPLNDWIKILDEYTSLNLVYLAGAYSEPTLYHHIIDLCKYLVKRNVKICINTNASARGDSFWKSLSEVLTPNDEVWFDVDGSTKDIHAVYRVNSNLNRVLHNASVFRSDKCNDHVQTIRFKYNEDDIDNVKALIKSEGFNKHSVIDSDKLTKCVNTPYKNPFDTDMISAVAPIEKKYNALAVLGKTILNNKADKQISCQSLSNRSVHIDHYGTIQPCCVWKERDIKNWDLEYDHILEFKHDECYMCEKSFAKHAKLLGVYDAYVF
jgi:MoaA/NifB/PqqE/SkfB family radical SAM enzyme